MEDGHTVDEARELFESRELRVVGSSDLAVGCFHASDFLFLNLRANAKNARLITELGGSAMIVHTDGPAPLARSDRKSTRLNSSHANTSYAVFCLKKKNIL